MPGKYSEFKRRLLALPKQVDANLSDPAYFATQTTALEVASGILEYVADEMRRIYSILPEITITRKEDGVKITLTDFAVKVGVASAQIQDKTTGETILDNLPLFVWDLTATVNYNSKVIVKQGELVHVPSWLRVKEPLVKRKKNKFKRFIYFILVTLVRELLDMFNEENAE